MEKDMIEAKAKLATAEADKAFASKRGNVAARKIAAKADFKKQKNQERKQTIRGAISQNIHNMLQKRGENRIKKMGDKTSWDAIQNGGRRLKRGAKAAGKLIDKMRNKTVSQISGSMDTYASNRRASEGLFGNSSGRTSSSSPKTKAKRLARALKNLKPESRSTYRTSGNRYSSSYDYEPPSGSGWDTSGYRRNRRTAAEQNEHNRKANKYKKNHR